MFYLWSTFHALVITPAGRAGQTGWAEREHWRAGDRWDALGEIEKQTVKSFYNVTSKKNDGRMPLVLEVGVGSAETSAGLLVIVVFVFTWLI